MSKYARENGQYVLRDEGQDEVFRGPKMAIVFLRRRDEAGEEVVSVLTHGSPREMDSWMNAHTANPNAAPVEVLVLDSGESVDTVNRALTDHDAFKALLAKKNLLSRLVLP